MGNITLSLDDNLIKEGREYAKKNQDTTLTSLIRKLLSETVMPASDDWIDECFSLMDKANGDSKGKKWTREGIYER